ncbi:MAG: hypothetical protein J7K26_03865 [Candidatus Aenigmarchaeota archaeon]|nr:hypothetical protein [Candidatus Aenigmarchaeota archaeon]
MNIKYLIPIFAIVSIVFVSGCIEGFDLSRMGFETSGPLSEQSADILVTKNIQTIPSSPILAGNEFSTIFELKNNDNIKTIENAQIKLFDWGACTPLIDEFVPSGWEKPGSYYIYTYDSLAPTQEERIEMVFKAPDNQRIGYLDADCNIKWETSYNFKAISQDDFTIISKTRLKELQRAGQSWQGTDQPQYVGIGPIKLYFDFKTPMPVQSKGSIQFSVKAVDKGSGTFATIPKGLLQIRVPEDWLEYDENGNLLSGCTRFEQASGATGDVLLQKTGSFVIMPMAELQTEEAGGKYCVYYPIDTNPNAETILQNGETKTYLLETSDLSNINSITLSVKKLSHKIRKSIIIKILEDGREIHYQSYILPLEGDANIELNKNIVLVKGRKYELSIENPYTQSKTDVYFYNGKQYTPYYKLCGSARAKYFAQSEAKTWIISGTEYTINMVEISSPNEITFYIDPSINNKNIITLNLGDEISIDESNKLIFSEYDKATGKVKLELFETGTEVSVVECQTNEDCEEGFECKDGQCVEISATTPSEVPVTIEQGYVTFVNSVPINLIQGKTPEILCKFKAPDLDEEQIPEKTYTVFAEIPEYTYKITNSKTVRIKPTVE